MHRRRIPYPDVGKRDMPREVPMPLGRHHLAERRKTLGYSQESFAEHLGVDRSTVARWERGNSEPYPFIRPKIARLLRIAVDELETLLQREATQQSARALPQPAKVATGRDVDEPDPDADELDDMNRRELLRMLSIAGTVATLPQLHSPETDSYAQPAATDELEQHEQLNAHLWQAFSLSRSKRHVYPMVRQQLDLLTTRLEQPHTTATHQRLCVLVGDLSQLAGEIFFDSNRYTDAAYCYSLAANASKEAEAHDLWACALTRHAYIGVYERRFTKAASTLSVASRVAKHSDSQLSTRHWVAAVHAQTFAGLGDLDACNRALDTADQVQTLSGPVKNDGWLRFDESRLAEERGTCYLELGNADLAETALTQALNQPISLRRRGSILTDLATLGVRRRDLDQVLHYGTNATELAEQTRSAGYIGRKLHALQTQLAPLMGDRRVSQLNERIGQLEKLA